MTSSAISEPGQILEIRDRLFLVTEVAQIERAEDPMPEDSNGRSHLVRMLSLDENAFGEVEEIIWENEPGILIREKPGLPDLSSMDDPNGCNAVLNAVRWGVADFVLRDIGEVGPEVDAQVDAAMMEGSLDLDTYWMEKKIRSIRRAPTEEGVLEGDPDVQGYWAKQDGGPGGGPLKFESSMRDYLSQLKRRLKEASADISAEHERLELVVAEALELAGQPPLIPVTLSGEPVDTDVWSEDLIFRMPGLHDSWAKCAQGLEHPQTGKPRPITFDHQTAEGTDDVVFCHLNHPLVRMSQRVLRTEIWAGREEKRLSRFQIRGVDEHLFGNMVIAHAWLMVTGRTGHLLHQELIQCGVEIRGLRGPPEVVDWRRIENEMLAMGAREEDLPEVRRWFAERWNGSIGFETAVTNALKARVDKRMKSVSQSLIKRRKEAIKDQISPLREMALAIRQETKAMLADQDDSGTEDSEQWANSVATMRARLELVESEAEQGAGKIKSRYDEPQTWVFPVTMALMYPREIRYP